MKKRYFISTWLVGESHIELFNETNGSFLHREETVLQLSKKNKIAKSQIALKNIFEFASEEDALDYTGGTMT